MPRERNDLQSDRKKNRERSDYYEHLLDEFLTEHNYGAKACHDVSWTELYTKEEETLFAVKLA